MSGVEVAEVLPLAWDVCITEAEHDPRCGGDSDLCARWCPIPVQRWLTREEANAELLPLVRAAQAAASALCSQCGEMPSAMVKIGTLDGWCDCAARQAAAWDEGYRANDVGNLWNPYGHRHAPGRADRTEAP